MKFKINFTVKNKISGIEIFTYLRNGENLEEVKNEIDKSLVQGCPHDSSIHVNK